MAEVKYAFELKSSDRNIRVVRYDQDLFELKDPYEIFIEIDMVEGRSEDFKRNLYTNIVTAIENRTLFKKENIFIFLNEQPAVNWGVKGGIPFSDFKEKNV